MNILMNGNEKLKTHTMVGYVVLWPTCRKLRGKRLSEDKYDGVTPAVRCRAWYCMAGGWSYTSHVRQLSDVSRCVTA